MAATPHDDAPELHCEHREASAAQGVATASERRTRWVVVVTLAMMIGELVVGTITGSLALTADGWHMGSHAGALGLSAVAYWYARTRAGEKSFSFGTGKVLALAGYTNALLLGLIAVWMVGEGFLRLAHPEKVDFKNALPVAVLGLVVNVVCASILMAGGDDGHGHAHGHSHGDDHDHAHDDGHDHDGAHAKGGDINLRSAYIHVVADALTSVFAIVAIVAGRWLGWTWLDSAMAIVGGAVILQWSVGLCRQSAQRLLDVSASDKLLARIRASIDALGGARVNDLHVWPIGADSLGCLVSIESRVERPLVDYRSAVRAVAKVSHLTIEVDHLGEESIASFGDA